jgi:hypothetical protein
MEDYNTVHPHSRPRYRSPRGVHSFPTRRVSGLTGSLHVESRWLEAGRRFESERS